LRAALLRFINFSQKNLHGFSPLIFELSAFSLVSLQPKRTEAVFLRAALLRFINFSQKNLFQLTNKMIREGHKIPADACEKIPEMVDSLSADRDVIALYAFGSLARGLLKPLSDLDIAILISNHIRGKLRFEKHLQILSALNGLFHTDEIDLVLLNDAPLRFSHSILRDGKLLFCRDFKVLINFAENVRKSYLDFRYYRNRFDEEFLKGIGYAHQKGHQQA
jgi:predicted nucleotidyltransferase